MTQKIIMTVLIILATSTSFAARKGGGSGFFSGEHSLGLGFASVNAGQDDLNKAIDDANAQTSGGISTKNLASGYEFFANWIIRFERSMFGIVIRPGYFTQNTTGSGNNQSFDYKLSGITFFPTLRMTPLENDFIKFFMQVGLGYGSLDADIQAAGQSLKFNGSAFGAMAGLGADFCFTPSHCLTVEGNVRYLPIERNSASSGCTTSIPGMSQCGRGQEVERSGKDLQTTLSGVMGVLAYTLNF
jgi:hypothetical protein